jgi:hypothetical protein
MVVIGAIRVIGFMGVIVATMLSQAKAANDP